MEAKPLNVLSLDGGGVRGLSSLLILQSLMNQLKWQSGIDQRLLPCEVFDLICGTSTGGLIALMLGRLRMSVEDAIENYLQFSERVFVKKRSVSQSSGFWKCLYRGLSTIHGGEGWNETRGTTMYDASVLEHCVKTIVRKYGGGRQNRNAPMEDPFDRDHRCCRTFVTAVNRDFGDSPPKRFRTYSTNESRADKCGIWEAVRATTAANPFFDPKVIDGVEYIDGALSGENNPSQLAIDEARVNFPGRPIGCFLSLGTGVPDAISVEGDLSEIAEACRKLLESCELVDNAVYDHFLETAPEGQKNPYFRFSVDRGLGNIALDEWKQVGKLTGITQGYMAFKPVEQQAQKCVNALRARAAEAMTHQKEEEPLILTV